MSEFGPESPCVHLCILDPDTGWCLGCGRSGSEIGDWMQLSDEQRHALNQELPRRLKQIADRDKMPKA